MLKKEKLVTGRPKKEFDKTQFEKLCGLHCTMIEICYFFKTTDKTLTKWCKRIYGCAFSEAFKTCSSGGKMSLRRIQFKLAERNAGMAIWLGKQYLNQKDYQHIYENDDGSKTLSTMTIVNKLVDETVDNKN